jgi:hypothetical protein
MTAHTSQNPARRQKIPKVLRAYSCIAVVLNNGKNCFSISNYQHARKVSLRSRNANEGKENERREFAAGFNNLLISRTSEEKLIFSHNSSRAFHGAVINNYTVN